MALCREVDLVHGKRSISLFWTKWTRHIWIHLMISLIKQDLIWKKSLTGLAQRLSCFVIFSTQFSRHINISIEIFISTRTWSQLRFTSWAGYIKHYKRNFIFLHIWANELSQSIFETELTANHFKIIEVPCIAADLSPFPHEKYFYSSTVVLICSI